eukprot:5890069-Pyramimonas_sp.AAC.1
MVAAQTGASSSAAPWQSWEGWDRRQSTWDGSDWRAREKRTAPRGDAHYADTRQRGRDFDRK